MIAAPAWAVALAWLPFPLWVLWCVRRSRHLREYPPLGGTHVPRVSVIVPARNEGHNVERCVRSILSTTYASMELIVVDDHSADATRDVALRAIAGDPRARVTTPPPLPSDWFGKQWACAHGASLATGDLLLFTDADTWHANDLLGRAVHALEERRADMLTIIGRQETVTFWERVVQPAVFLALLAGVGSLEAMSRGRSAQRTMANGQFMLMRRDVYDTLGGHAAVRAYVAEDIMLGQLWRSANRAVHALFAMDEFSTRMYWSLSESIEGWRKNAWAGGRHAFGSNPVVRAVTRIVLPLSPLFGVIPVAALVLGATGVAGAWTLAFGAWAFVFETAGVALAFAAMRFPASSALLYPLGCIVCAYIYLTAAIRGDRTAWKGRDYTAA